MSHYLTLGVSEQATPDEIKKAFRELAKKHHPDANQGDPKAEAKFKGINEAYETLKDPQKREQYDLSRKPGFHGHQGFNQNGFDPFDMFFRFDQGFAQQRPKNRDTIIKYAITLEEAYTGKTVDLRFRTGSGTTRELKLEIPQSIRFGSRIRYAGMGEDSIKGVPTGDLYVQIVFEPNTNFVRMEYDIVTTVYVDFIDAMTGTNKRVKCIDGSEINLRVHAGMNPGQHIQVPEKGYVKPNGSRGTMMVEVVMEQPKLTEAQLSALSRIKDLK